MTSLMRREEGREVRHPFVLEVEGVVEVGIFDILKIESKNLNLCFSQKKFAVDKSSEVHMSDQK